MVLYLEPYKVIPKRNYLGAYGYYNIAMAGLQALRSWYYVGTARNVDAEHSLLPSRCASSSLQAAVHGFGLRVSG